MHLPSIEPWPNYPFSETPVPWRACPSHNAPNTIAVPTNVYKLNRSPTNAQAYRNPNGGHRYSHIDARTASCLRRRSQSRIAITETGTINHANESNKRRSSVLFSSCIRNVNGNVRNAPRKACHAFTDMREMVQSTRA